jgi:hypothetical protein
MKKYILFVFLGIAQISCAITPEGEEGEASTTDLVLKLKIVNMEYPVTVVEAEGKSQIKIGNASNYVNTRVGMKINASNILFVSENSRIVLQGSKGKKVELQKGTYAIE